MRTRKTIDGLLAVALMAGTVALLHPATAPAQDADPVAGMAYRDSAVVVDSLSAAPADAALPEELTAVPPLPETPRATAPSPVSEVLPFARNELPMGYPSFGVGGGVGSYFADLGDVERAFHTIEDVHASDGFPVPRARAVKLDPMALWNLTMRCSRTLDVAFQLGRTKGEPNRLRTTGVLVTHRFLSTRDGGFSMLAGLGGGTYGFSFTQAYYVVVSPVDANGGYYTLDRVDLEGGGSYWTGTGGFTLRPGTHTSIDVRAQYVGMSDASADAGRSGRISMDLSGVLVGASLTFFL